MLPLTFHSLPTSFWELWCPKLYKVQKDMEKSNFQLFSAGAATSAATCAHTQPRALCVLASVFQWDVFFKDSTKFTLFICILLYSLIPFVMVYCYSYLWCTFSKCCTFDLSLLISGHIFHFSKAFGSLSLEVLLVSTNILLLI